MGKRQKCQDDNICLSHFKHFTLCWNEEKLKPCCWPLPTFDWVNSRKLAARPSSSVSLSVFMATFKMWIGSSWTLWMTKQIHIFVLRYTIIQVNDQPVTSRGLFLSPCCLLHHTGQDYLPLGRLDLGEGSRRSSSTRLLYFCRGEKKKKKKRDTPLIMLVLLSPPTEGIYPSWDPFSRWTHLVKSWKERKATIAPMRWQGGVKDVSNRTSLTLATCTMP